MRLLLGLFFITVAFCWLNVAYGANPTISYKRGFVRSDSKNFYTLGGHVTPANEGYQGFILDADYRRHKPYSENSYVIWAPIPLGLGFKFNETISSMQMAEWVTKFKFVEPVGYALGPQFTGGLLWDESGHTNHIKVSYMIARTMTVDRWFTEAFIELGRTDRIVRNLYFGVSAEAKYSTVFLTFFENENTSKFNKRYSELNLKYSLDWMLNFDTTLSPNYTMSMFRSTSGEDKIDNKFKLIFSSRF